MSILIGIKSKELTVLINHSRLFDHNAQCYLLSLDYNARDCTKFCSSSIVNHTFLSSVQEMVQKY